MSNVVITSKELLEQQVQEVMTQRRKSPRGVEMSKRTGVQYNTQLQFLTREVKKDIDDQLIPLLRNLESEYTADASWFAQITNMLQILIAKWSSPNMQRIAEQLAGQFVTTADKVNEQRIARQFGVNIYSSDPQMEQVLEAAVYNNVQLIKSIPAQYLGQVENIVLTNTRAGNRSSAMVKALQEQYGVTQRRAKMIARDQTAKVNGDLNAKRQQVAGFPYFQWVTSNDERVRDRHEDIAEKVTEYGPGVYRWDNPPLSDKGIPIIPGNDYQCRCTARPVSQREVDRNKEAGRTRPGVKR